MAPEARSISPNQEWLGNDGPWSTFPIVVGNPPVTLFVLPATSGRSTWVVSSQACPTTGAPMDCEAQRGSVISLNRSTSFRPDKDRNSYFALNFESESTLNSALPPGGPTYSGSGFVGNDTLRFGFNSDDAPVLENQLIVEYANPIPFLGLLGLSWANETITTLQDIHPSVIGALRSMDAIPSNAWGYTAGAQYRNAYASLVLGGYDASRGNTENVLTVQMAEQTDRQLVVQITKTVMGNSTQSQTYAPEFSIPIFVDSVVPEIWLPQEACAGFEDAFGLVWNDTVKMYLVDDDLHNRLSESNQSVNITLAAGDSSDQRSLTISLPYAAFNLTAGWPLLDALYPNDPTATMRYFPLKRANETEQYYLGRTFLQEAYVVADYDNRVFNISPAKAGSDVQDIRDIVFKDSSNKSSSLSGGAIAGIVIGALAAVAIVAGLLWWFCWRKPKGKKKERRSTLGTSSIGDNTTIAEWNNDVPMHQVEQYKPSEMSGDEADQFKPELDATVTARGAPTERHELWAGHVRRPSDQSRASISPLEERVRNSRFGHNRTISSNSFGSPSPPMSDHPSPPLASSGRESPFGQPSPPTGARTPASADQDRSWFGGVPVFELHGRSRDSPRSPTSPFRAPEEMPLSSENVQGQGERETRRSGFVEEFDRPAQSEGRS